MLEFSIQESSLNAAILLSLQEVQVYKKEMYEMFLSDEPRQIVMQKIQEYTRINYLNKRHSQKLSILFKQCFLWSDKDLMKARVHTRDGDIYTKIKVATPKYPLQIPGYADWLYCRRNALVHGNNNELFERDINYIADKYHIHVPSIISLRIGSIKTCANFYMNLCNIMKSANSLL